MSTSYAKSFWIYQTKNSFQNNLILLAYNIFSESPEKFPFWDNKEKKKEKIICFLKELILSKLLFSKLKDTPMMGPKDIPTDIVRYPFNIREKKIFKRKIL